MKQLQADVVVIAAGAAGLAASVSAAELGAKVINFEKAATTGGTGNMGMGPLGIESRLQRLKQMPLTVEMAFKTFMDYTHWRSDARLVQAYLSKSASTIEWLEKMGVEFVEPAAYFPSANPTWHLVKPEVGNPGPQSSATMMKRLTERAKKLGVEFYLQTPVKRIIKEKGRITGVLAEDKSGEPIQVAAKAVVVATGGFGDSPDLIKKNTGYEWGKDFFSIRIPGLVGDGIRMVQEVGAGPDTFNMEIIFGLPPMVDPELSEAFRQPNLMVNIHGDRIMDESVIGNTTFTGNAIARQKGRVAFNIFDENTKNHFVNVGLDSLSFVHPIWKLEHFDELLRKAMESGYKGIFVADTIEELAAKTGIDAANLKKTIDEYNVVCDNGRDEMFYKKGKYLRPIRNPKFYAGKLFPGAYGSLGGIKINYRCEVVTKDDDPIPGLYAAGTDACSIYGDSYVFVLPGNTQGFALNSGRMCGEHAVAYIKTVS